MKTYVTDTIFPRTNMESFDNIQEFKKWADAIYDKYKNIDCEISIDGHIGYDYEDSYGEVSMEISYEREETVDEEENRIVEKEATIVSDILIPMYMKSNNIPNNMGTRIFQTMLESDLLKQSKEDFLIFKAENFNVAKEEYEKKYE